MCWNKVDSETKFTCESYQFCPDDSGNDWIASDTEHALRNASQPDADFPNADPSTSFGMSSMDVDSLNFGLFKPGPKALFVQSLPVLWPTWIAIWPQLLSQFLSLMWCTPIQEDGCVKQRLVPNPDVVCLSQDHLPTFLIAVVGLSVWCVGIPGLLFTIIFALGRARQELESHRRYGLFIRGLEPSMWWWDLVIKRADIGAMMLIAYTSMVEDENAKLFMFAFISGMLLSLTTWFKPYSTNQGQILDILETSLLTSRFILYFMVALLLIILPSPTTVRICAYGVLAMLILVSTFTLLHIVAQILRQQHNLANEEDFEEDEHDEEDSAIQLGPGSLRDRAAMKTNTRGSRDSSKGMYINPQKSGFCLEVKGAK